MNLNELKHQTECRLESVQGSITVTPEYQALKASISPVSEEYFPNGTATAKEHGINTPITRFTVNKQPTDAQLCDDLIGEKGRVLAEKLLRAVKDTQGNDGWVKHDGKGQPVPNRTRVEVELRGGDEYYYSGRIFSEEWRWEHLGGDGDIMAYRIVDESEEKEPKKQTLLEYLHRKHGNLDIEAPSSLFASASDYLEEQSKCK